MDNPRVLLSIALSFLVLMLWQAWVQDYGPKPEPAAVESTSAPAGGQAPSQGAAGTGQPATGGKEDLPALPEEEAAAPAPESEISIKLAKDQRVDVVTDLFHAVIDTRGGNLREVDLLKYPVSLEKDAEPFKLLDESPDKVFIAQGGLRVGKGPEPNHHASYRVEQNRFELKADAETIEVPLHWSSGDGIEVTKLYRFRRGSYVVEVEYRIHNSSPHEWIARPYQQLQRTPPVKKQRFLYTYTGAVLYSPEEKYEKISFEDIEEHPLDRKVKGGWAAMIQHYFLAAWIPPADQTDRYYTRALKGERYVIGMIGPGIKVPSGGEQSTSARLFVGPKLQHVLEKVAPGLELTVDYGKLTILAKPIFWLLEHIHALVGNWGWSIIFLTMLIKGAFFKLSETSYKSMAKMRNLAPRMQALKERYGDDKQKLNQAMMEMYKKEKVNPLGGCLPVLVQIPVFIALYWVLLESVEMRQAPFMLWIQNLSAPDPYYVLPLIMGVTMFIQQKLNPAPMDPIQAKVMMILPVVFTVFFAFFPAGLVLYWVVNNTLSIAQQWVITKRVAAAS